MRLAVAVVLVGCTSQQPARQAVVPSASPSPPDLICPPSTLSALRGKDPNDGGYRVLQDDAAVEALNAAIKAREADVAPEDGHRRFDAVEAALHDMRSEVQACWRDADHPTPETQYELVLTIYGDAAGSTVMGTTVKRVEGASADGAAVLADTNAEACVARLFARLALPPGRRLATSHWIVRSDFCTTPTALAFGTMSAYADAYRRWRDDHRGVSCPMALSDLNSYARRTSADDPWSRSYVMHCSANGFEIVSAGPDRELGTADDLSLRR